MLGCQSRSRLKSGLLRTIANHKESNILRTNVNSAFLNFCTTLTDKPKFIEGSYRVRHYSEENPVIPGIEKCGISG